MARMREAVLRRELAGMLQERDALNGEIAAMRADVAGLETDLADQSAEVEKLRSDVAQRDMVIAALYASRSWRLAAPARGISTLLRRPLARPGERRPEVLLLPAPAPAFECRAAAEAVPQARGRGTLLVAADMLPLFDQSSGGLRLKTLMGMMGDAGWSMVFGSMLDNDHQPGLLANPEQRRRYEAALRGIGVTRFIYGLAEIGSFLSKSGRDLAWAFLSFPAVAVELLPLVRSYCPTTRVAYDMVDFHGLRMAREGELRDDQRMMAAAEQQRAVEIACARAADVTIAVTEEERATLQEMVPDVVVEVLPNAFEVLPHSPPSLAGREGLFFVGGFWHTPNGDAMHWFVDRVWPLIREEAPSTILRIAGANPDVVVLALGARPGVEVLGFVPDLTQLYAQHRVFVAPMRFGAGMKGKVGQSLMHGLPVVATLVGAEGMGLQDGVHLLVADQEQEFAAQVLRLLRDDGLWFRLATQGRKHIERTLSVDAVRVRLEAVLGG